MPQHVSQGDATQDAPDQAGNWSQVRETVVMLYLSAAQIESAMHEGSTSVHQLTDAFTNISAASAELSSALQQDTAANNTQALQAAAKIDAQIQGTIVAFQFHDRISQRLHNVTQALQKLSGLIEAAERLNDPGEWLQLQQDIKQGYTMESERLMFEHIMLGASVEEALAIYHHHFNDLPLVDETTDDIELF
jgi:methyl-accepting chemotaxis protein